MIDQVKKFYADQAVAKEKYRYLFEVEGGGVASSTNILSNI